LDGSRILYGILPEEGQAVLAKIEPYSLLILFALLFTGILNPIIIGAENVILAFIKFALRI
jgi:Zn-dependent protease